MMNSEEGERPLKDYGSFTHTPVGEDEIASHHTDRWQNQAMMAMRFPERRPRKRHHKKRHSRPNTESKLAQDSTPAPQTPPSERVKFILGTNLDDDDQHEPHEMFCEMEELRHFGDGDMEWKETARWIKFEENVEEGGERWSKPHVATLSLHSLFELRKGILSGTVVLDAEAKDLTSIADLLIDQMIASKQVDFDARDKLLDVLLTRHRHQHEKKHEGHSKGLPLIRSLADIGKKNSEKKLEGREGSGTGSDKHLGDHLAHADTTSSSLHKPGSQRDVEGGLTEAPSSHKFNEHFAKKIPPGAEAATILVGEVDFLTTPVMCFMRLHHAMLLADLTEVPVPTRFFFLLLGPKGHRVRYREIGRSIATLMSDEVFHDVAYRARNRDDLISGIDEFLDQVTVLPPGEWDPTIRIEPPKSVPSQESRKTAAPGGMPNGLVVDEEKIEEHGDPTLQRTGRIFGGLINDIRRKVPWYVSDFKDAIHVQAIASFFFMYFACLTPIITFGGLLGSATDNNIAAMESLVSGAVCGVSYHLFSGQPLTIIGSTGPVLVFETIVFNFTKDQGWDYLAFRFWIGMWVSLTLLIIVAFDLSALVRYITRFTEESFAVLIALIFIVEAFKKLFHILDDYPVDIHWDQPKDFNCYCIPQLDDEDNNTTPAGLGSTMMTYLNSSLSPNKTPVDWMQMDKDSCAANHGVMVGSGCTTPHYFADVFFFSCLLFLGTFALSMSLKNFRNSRFFPNRARSLISDFAVFTAITVMVVIDILIGLDTPKLNVPEKFQPTRSDRGWIINPFKNPVWCIFAGIPPALLCTILIFMDQQITAVIVNRKENLLKKGGGYHLDLFMIAIQMAICSALGTPWFVAATVLSINHVRSLTKESETSAPGERPKFLGVREQRVTGTIVFIWVGLSALLAAVLKHIPMAVLYGVFLFMGVSSVKGLQLIQRMTITLMPAKYQPDYIFLRHVPLRRVHLFTAIQVLCLAILWVIKTIKSVSIIFPLMVLAMCFVRKALDYVFTHHELKWLDDIMPESHKREKEEKKKKMMKNMEEENKEQMIEMTGGAINIPLKDGKTIAIPVDSIYFDPISNQVSITDETSRSAILTQLATAESDPRLLDYAMRHRSPVDDVEVKKPKSKEKREPVRFQIAEDETDHLMMAPPEIVVDPPSKQ